MNTFMMVQYPNKSSRTKLGLSLAPKLRMHMYDFLLADINIKKTNPPTSADNGVLLWQITDNY